MSDRRNLIALYPSWKDGSYLLDVDEFAKHLTILKELEELKKFMSLIAGYMRRQSCYDYDPKIVGYVSYLVNAICHCSGSPKFSRQCRTELRPLDGDPHDYLYITCFFPEIMTDYGKKSSLIYLRNISDSSPTRETLARLEPEKYEQIFNWCLTLNKQINRVSGTIYNIPSDEDVFNVLATEEQEEMFYRNDKFYQVAKEYESMGYFKIIERKNEYNSR